MTTETETMIRVRIPFAGFYCSVHDQAMDDALMGINQNEDGDPATVLEQDNVDWRQVRLAYAQACVKDIAETMGVALTFGEIVSPRFYNFETDQLLADITPTDLASVLARIEADPDLKEGLRAHVHEVLEPRSGFIPFYANTLDDWGPLEDWDEQQAGVMLDFWFTAQDGCEYEIAETKSEMLDGAIWDAIIDTSKVAEHVDNHLGSPSF